MCAQLSVDFLSDQDARLLQLFSHNDAQEFNIPPGRSRFCVTLKELPLVPGKYGLAVWAGYGQTTFDLVWDCYSVTVSTGAFSQGNYIENRGFPLVAQSAWMRLE